MSLALPALQTNLNYQLKNQHDSILFKKKGQYSYYRTY